LFGIFGFGFFGFGVFDFGFFVLGFFALGFFGFGFFLFGCFGLFGFFGLCGFFGRFGFFGFFGLGFFFPGFFAEGLLAAVASSVELERSFMQWQQPKVPQSPFKEVADRSNLLESVPIWRGAARLTQPPNPSNCSAQPLSAHQLDCKAEGKEMVWEGWRRVKAATTRILGTEVISDPPLLVICVPDFTGGSQGPKSSVASHRLSLQSVPSSRLGKKVAKVLL